MSEKLADSSEYRHGNMVFFDLLGVVVVAYPARVGTILNYMVATATFLYLAKKASLPGNGGGSPFPLVDSCHVMSFPVLGVSGMFSSLWIFFLCCFLLAARGFTQDNGAIPYQLTKAFPVHVMNMYCSM